MEQGSVPSTLAWLGALACVGLSGGCNAINGIDSLTKTDGLEGSEELVPVEPKGAARHMSCGATSGGEILCWGSGLPHSDFDVAANPALMPALAGAERISIGLSHGCVVIGSQASCWGQNDYGQLGNGSFEASREPVPVQGLGGDGLLDNVKRITRGDHHSCVQNTNNEALCWGSNSHGQLGDGTTQDSPVPVLVNLPGPVQKVSGSAQSTCAVLDDSRVFCWGRNDRGQCGQGITSTDPVLTPTEVTGVSAEKVFGGGQFMCAHTSAGTATCWGAGDRGQLGNGASQDSATPVTVSGLAGIDGLSPGTRHCCAGTPNGILCWGSNEYGQLANDDVQDLSTTPVVPNAGGFDGNQITALYAGGEHVCGTYGVDGRIYCWGLNDSGQLGDGTMGGSSGPSRVGP
jgi:alpha-tubulin suppressor-like RCC1 family protein